MEKIGLILKGVAMGMAEAIPGVSGGTIAFITGIYEEILDTIKSIHLGNLQKLFRDPREFWVAINGRFLILLLLGMGFGIGLGVVVISHLLVTKKELLWAFFFGLILASSIYFALRLSWDRKLVAFGLAGLLISFLITILSPSQGSESYLYIFMAGTIAVSALMLPGLSGSFILLLLGLYETIINSLKDLITELEIGRNLVILVVFSGGVIVGLFSFARILSFLFKRYHGATMAFMIGILVGSLNKLWPWKLIETALEKDTGMIVEVNHILMENSENYKIISESNLLPMQYANFGDPQILPILVSFAFGFVIIFVMGRIAKG